MLPEHVALKMSSQLDEYLDQHLSLDEISSLIFTIDLGLKEVTRMGFIPPARAHSRQFGSVWIRLRLLAEYVIGKGATMDMQDLRERGRCIA